MPIKPMLKHPTMLRSMSREDSRPLLDCSLRNEEKHNNTNGPMSTTKYKCLMQG